MSELPAPASECERVWRRRELSLQFLAAERESLTTQWPARLPVPPVDAWKVAERLDTEELGLLRQANGAPDYRDPAP